MAVLVLDSRSTAEILLAGELDLDTAAVLEPVVTDILIDPQVQRIVIDGAMTTFCDSSGLSALVRAQHHARNFNVPLHLVRPSLRLSRILAATGLWQTLVGPAFE